MTQKVFKYDFNGFILSKYLVKFSHEFFKQKLSCDNFCSAGGAIVNLL